MLCRILSILKTVWTAIDMWVLEYMNWCCTYYVFLPFMKICIHYLDYLGLHNKVCTMIYHVYSFSVISALYIKAKYMCSMQIKNLAGKYFFSSIKAITSNNTCIILQTVNTRACSALIWRCILCSIMVQIRISQDKFVFKYCTSSWGVNRKLL